MTGFDPYHKWLGIAPKDQPANHYRLLGIDLFEADPDAISNAADRQMAHVRSFQTGQNAEISQRILNEIAAARVCLLNAPRKAEYDAWLRGTLVPSPVAVVVPAPVANSRPVQSKRSKIDSTTAVLAGTAVVLCLAIAVLLAARSKPNASSVAAKKSPVVAQKEDNPKRESELPEKTASDPAPRRIPQQDTKAPDVPPVMSRQELAKAPSDPVTLVNSIGMKFVRIPPGEFDMGLTPEEKHRVRISRGYYLGVYEVTQGEYEQVMGVNPSHFSRNGKGKVLKDTSRHPVETVSWEDAIEFCRRLSAMPDEQRAPRSYRLPTEAEWEYACRAGSTSKWCYGDDESVLKDYAWYDGFFTHPVGQKKPNAWGLHDMHGNVWEWCMDRFGPYPKSPVTDPTGPATGATRVWRGGSFNWCADYALSGMRHHATPDRRTNGYGVRVVCCLAQSKGEAIAEKIPPQPEPIPKEPEQAPKEQGESDTAKLPVPDKSAQEKARDLAKELFGADHAAAKGSPEKLSALAARMIPKATETQDAAIQYTLLDIARILSVEAGDITLAVQAVDRMGETFQIDSSTLKAESIEAIIKSPHSPEQVSILLGALDPVLEACLADDDFAMAKTLGRAASTLARKSRDGTIVKQVAARNREIEERERMYQKKIVPALESMKQHPDNPLANSIVGEYTCFVKGDWHNGLPRLAVGEDATIRELAGKEVAGLSGASDKLKVADGWWELAQNDEKHKQQIQAHAADLYQQLPGLSGIDKMRAEQRIKLSMSGETKATKNVDRRRKVKARIYAACDNRFVMCINEQQVLEGDMNVATVDYAFARGDLITVRSKDEGVTKSFCCVIKFETGEIIVSGPRWSGYTPASQDEWYKVTGKLYPVSFAPPMEQDPVRRIQAATGVAIMPIWGQGNPCYLMLRIK